ncbi:IQ domain-containing protein IQM2-like [Prosopis cineraria]|uniref:IQ domain-containing protein IQM2-like n=1 Tax=Prosopis cineraria TaxID=364024 RepID=UPI0024104590|nr:IQ domain-containing protein IQM2-like [Prosopis cineraria]
MAISFSCSFAKYNNVEDGLDCAMARSINFSKEVKTLVRSVSFKHQGSEPTIRKCLGSGKMTIEKSVSFKRKDMERIITAKILSFDSEKILPASRISQNRKEMDDLDHSPRFECLEESIHSQTLDLNNPKHMAAVKLQKVYKSFRTRRKLADCAILVEQSWWKLLDFAELKRSSISFFDIEKHETATSRWSRARTKAAKVGKGLSKDDKGQKLALQHWLEAIDPRHRYGHNLNFYYDKWLQCQSREPFFYWLDIGEGKEVNLEKCPRSKLQHQCIKYLGPVERLAYEVVVKGGRFFYKQSGDLLHTNGEGGYAKWIFVLSTLKTLYVGKKNKGSFQHSSFLAGGATSAAGRLIVEYGVLKAVWPHSGHYRPTEENFKEFISFLQENNVNLSDVKMNAVDDDELESERGKKHVRNHSSMKDMTESMSCLEVEEIIDEDEDLLEGKANLLQKESSSTVAAPRTKLSILGRELSNLEIPERGQICESFQVESPKEFQEGPQRFVSELNHTVLKQDDTNGESIPAESILKRINSHQGMKSYQLGRQLSCKWTTGAGPRIGCVRDYPSELQFRALEQVNLSPRSRGLSKSSLSPRTPTGLSRRVSTPRSLFSETTTIGTPSESGDHDSRSDSLQLFRGTSVIPVIYTS